jgi:hypothetical protein
MSHIGIPLPWRGNEGEVHYFSAVIFILRNCKLNTLKPALLLFPLGLHKFLKNTWNQKERKF